MGVFVCPSTLCKKYSVSPDDTSQVFIPSGGFGLGSGLSYAYSSSLNERTPDESLLAADMAYNDYSFYPWPAQPYVRTVYANHGISGVNVLYKGGHVAWVAAGMPYLSSGWQVANLPVDKLGGGQVTDTATYICNPY
jgi:hypothetical protein